MYSALNLINGQVIAVKQVNYTNLDKKDRSAQVKALETEIEMLKQLKHPNIVKYLGTYRDKHRMYIFLEYCSGGSVASVLKRFGSLSEAVIRRYLRGCLRGLSYLHSHDVIHRDIKGNNVLIVSGDANSDDLVKLADFGSSKKITGGSSSGGSVVQGTIQWMSPEVLSGKPCGKESDMWSLAMTVVEMATGKPYWPKPAHCIYMLCMTSEIPQIPSSLSPAAHSFLSKCFSRNVDERPTAANALRDSFLVQPDTISESTVSLYSSQARRRDDDDDNFSATSDLITVRGQWVEIASDNNSAVIDGGGGSSGVDALFYKT